MSNVEGAVRGSKSLDLETLLPGFNEIRIDDARGAENRSLPSMRPIEGSAPDVRDVLTMCAIDPETVGRITGEVVNGVLRLKIEGVSRGEQ